VFQLDPVYVLLALGGRDRSHYVTITPGPSSPKFHDDRGNLWDRARAATRGIRTRAWPEADELTS
jgi:hypothetical protein